MKDFGLSCGHHLLDRDPGGGLVVTDEFLKAYLARPELNPPPEACVVERTLHAALVAAPPRPAALFINQLVHAILRNALDGVDDPFVLRAAELMFRPQRLTLLEGSLVAADDELIAGAEGARVSPLVSMMGLPEASGVEVINEDNAGSYFARSDRFDMALDLTAGRR